MGAAEADGRSKHPRITNPARNVTGDACPSFGRDSERLDRCRARSAWASVRTHLRPRECVAGADRPTATRASTSLAASSASRRQGRGPSIGASGPRARLRLDCRHRSPVYSLAGRSDGHEYCVDLVSRIRDGESQAVAAARMLAGPAVASARLNVVYGSGRLAGGARLPPGSRPRLDGALVRRRRLGRTIQSLSSLRPTLCPWLLFPFSAGCARLRSSSLAAPLRLSPSTTETGSG